MKDRKLDVSALLITLLSACTNFIPESKDLNALPYRGGKQFDQIYENEQRNPGNSESNIRSRNMIAITSKKLIPLQNIYRLSTLKMRNVSNDVPLFRQNFNLRTEEQLNFQISQELNASHAYLAMANFFGRTEISLHGSSSFFRAMSDEEREHAFALIDYQNMRGGKVKLIGAEKPNGQLKDEFSSLSAAIEESLVIERGNTEALTKLVHVAEKDGDIVTVDFICSKFLNEQMSALQTLGNILTQLNRFDQKGLGEYFIDLEFQKKYPRKS